MASKIARPKKRSRQRMWPSFLPNRYLPATRKHQPRRARRHPKPPTPDHHLQGYPKKGQRQSRCPFFFALHLYPKWGTIFPMATRTAMIRARIEPEIKTEAETVLRRLGLRPSDAISMFYHQIILHQGMPFDIRLPTERANAEEMVHDAPSTPTLDPDAREWELGTVFDRLRELDQWRHFVMKLRGMELDVGH
ncbi:MAG: type II toxin-antitoxin system RelB/DinJ family antitoxin [Candidatus Dadabacteria bacterium]|nr:MAG: type II toxin-antitoxin system RelB/DinJ family antitoxin [Candidatus Dadabacteria bacterium]